jgi:hypothetical protein
MGHLVLYCPSWLKCGKRVVNKFVDRLGVETSREIVHPRNGGTSFNLGVVSVSMSDGMCVSDVYDIKLILVLLSPKREIDVILP